jgi:hypothetical protein
MITPFHPTHLADQVIQSARLARIRQFMGSSQYLFDEAILVAKRRRGICLKTRRGRERHVYLEGGKEGASMTEHLLKVARGCQWDQAHLFGPEVDADHSYIPLEPAERRGRA